jgi:hypothetical protein
MLHDLIARMANGATPARLRPCEIGLGMRGLGLSQPSGAGGGGSGGSTAGQPIGLLLILTKAS